MNETFLDLVAELISLASAQAQVMGVLESLIIFNLLCGCVCVCWFAGSFSMVKCPCLLKPLRVRRE